MYNAVPLLTLFAQRTYVNILHWIVGLYYYGFSIHLLLVYYIIKLSTQPVLLYDPLLFPFIILQSHMYKTLSYQSHTVCLFTLLTLWFIYI